MLPRSAIHIARVNWAHRALIVDLVRREFRLRYVGSILGSWWNVVHPIVMIGIYSVIFSGMMKSRIAAANLDHPFGYTIFLCSALLPWNALVETVNRGSAAFVENANLVRKVAFPLELFIPVVGGVSTLNFFISYGLFLVFAMLSGVGLSPNAVLLPVVFMIQLVFALGLCLGLSTLTVFFRDIQQFTAIGLNIWFWLTPIVYVRDVLPARFRYLVDLNPFSHFALLYQKLSTSPTLPDWTTWANVIVWAAASFVFGSSLFSHFKPDIPDEL